MLCPLLAVGVHREHIAFCKSHGRFLPFISAIPSFRMFIAASLPFCNTFLVVSSPRPASSARWYAVQLRHSSDVSLSCTLPSAVTGTKSFFWQNGQPLLVLCSPALLVKKCLFMLPVGTLSSSFDEGGETPVAVQHHHIRVSSNLVSDGLDV